ncbi:major facilitator superfamily domain-containing protein [Dactylonectria estremocensis]|uniref:Major facilitator superfamily domain-containing protein n=1 Tax=Dactylonectria estremocensis TaxID=1079267 RepID=A0A9P9EPL0_9HYPO|nr:major facilitator superfamily domain-containing protein [Dactylonectria estremocensis]
MSWKSKFSRLAIAKKHERSPEEKAFVRRLDLFLMTFGCISQVIKYLDQTNITTAFVSGMKEDLALNGNELNYFTVYFNIGYCIMLIPSQIIMTYVRPSLWLPGLEIIWGVITGLIAIVHNSKQIYALRFFLGFLESSAWPGMITLLMYWYTPSELAKRMGFYHSARAVGGMMSGALQVAILKTLDGKNGLEGWRWLFIINSVMTVVLGFFGFVMIPDTPNQPNPWAKWWFSADHARIAMERLDRHGRAEAKKITWAATNRMWITYYIPVYWVVSGMSAGALGYFAVFLRNLFDAQGNPVWSTTQVNSIPIGGGAIQVVFIWVWCILSDLLQVRWQLMVVQSLIGIIPAVIMTTWTRHPDTVSLSAAYASYFITYGIQASGLILLAWFTDMYPKEPEVRSLVVGAAVVAIYAVDAATNVRVWPATQAPYYTTGWSVVLGMWIGGVLLVLGLWQLDIRVVKPQQKAAREAGLDPETAARASSDGGKEHLSETDIEHKGSNGSDRGTIKVSQLV